MQEVAEETRATSPDPRPTSRDQITLATSLVIVAAIAASCALVVQIKRKYEAIPAFAAPVCPEAYATPAVLLWIILGSIATFAWRRCSVTRLAAQIAVSCVLVMSRLWNPAGVGVPGAGMYHEALWPVVCFGAFFVTPLLLYRFSRIGDSVLVFADSAVVALFAYLFAVQPYVPKM
jgi:hypothetical protein